MKERKPKAKRGVIKNKTTKEREEEADEEQKKETTRGRCVLLDPHSNLTKTRHLAFALCLRLLAFWCLVLL
jgi:hypothetical protein